MNKLYDAKCTNPNCAEKETIVSRMAEGVDNDVLVDSHLRELQCEACRQPLRRILSAPHIVGSRGSENRPSYDWVEAEVNDILAPAFYWRLVLND